MNRLKRAINGKWRWTAREAMQSDYFRKLYRNLYPTKRCAHWLFKRVRVVGHIQHDFKHHSSKCLWVEVV